MEVLEVTTQSRSGTPLGSPRREDARTSANSSEPSQPPARPARPVSGPATRSARSRARSSAGTTATTGLPWRVDSWLRRWTEFSPQGISFLRPSDQNDQKLQEVLTISERRPPGLDQQDQALWDLTRHKFPKSGAKSSPEVSKLPGATPAPDCFSKRGSP
jgi:hypothetical protein